MRARWEALHSSLEQSVSTLEANQQFKVIKAGVAAMERFEEPIALLDYLADPGGDRDTKDTIYGVLVRAAQDQVARAATTLLWLGLWPALDGIYRRRLKLFPGKPEELVSELAHHFSVAIERADLSRINRVAATLVLNTERQVMDARRRQWNDDALHEDGDDDESAEPAMAPAELSEVGVPAGLDAQAEIAALRDWVARFVGDDADLVIGAVIYDENHRELADRLGLTHEAARKRFQRAIARLRERVQHAHPELSQFAGHDRVSPASPEKGR